MASLGHSPASNGRVTVHSTNGKHVGPMLLLGVLLMTLYSTHGNDKSRTTRDFTTRVRRYIGNESVPKIIINGTVAFFLNCNQQFGNFKP